MGEFLIHRIYFIFLIYLACNKNIKDYARQLALATNNCLN